MAFLESNGIHYRPCCDECGAIGALSETMRGSVKATQGWTWRTEDNRVRCATCSHRCQWGGCDLLAQPLTVYCSKHSREADKNLRKALAECGK